MRRLVCLLTLFSLCSFTIEDPFLTLLKKLEEFTKRYPTEKVHLHLDKPYYAAGDNIWFKAYVADARTSQPASESNILYVELINTLDSVCNQLRLPMQNGITWGDFKLTDTLTEGSYRIRAYTQLMRNAGPDFFFDKTIKIGNKWTNRAFTKTTFVNNTASVAFTDSLGKEIVNRPVSYSIRYGDKTMKGRIRTDSAGRTNILLPPDAKTGNILASIDLGKGKTSLKTIPIPNQSTKIDVKFLPEGGQLVDGITSRIAIKAIDAQGKGIDVSGAIVDDRGDEVTTFQTTHLGMGSFYFSPMSGKNYTAKMKLNNGIDHSVSLPKSFSNGYVINATQLDTANVNIKVTISAGLLNKGDLNLIAHKNGMVIQSAKVSTAKQVARINLTNNKLPSGIVQLTLLSPQDVPIAERLIFVNNASEKADVELVHLKSSYAKKEKTALEFRNSTQGNFSVAVTNTDVVQLDEANETNIMTSMLLNSDLRGYIEKPNYYFMNNDAATKEHLDNLLLTQGWRKLDWKAIDTLVPRLAAEKSITISGTITKDKKPLANSKISLMSNTSGMFMIDTLSDKNGRFAFEGLEFPDSTKFIIQARSELGKKTVDIKLDIIDGQRVMANTNYGEVEVNVNQSMQSYLKESTVYFEEQSRQGLLSKTILLKEVKVVGEKKNPAKNSANFNGAGNADQVFDGEDMMFFPSITSFLSGKSRLSFKNGTLTAMRRGKLVPRIFVDGNLMWPEFSINDILVEDVESIEILASPSKTAIYGETGKDGLALVTTRRGPPKWPVIKYAPGVITYKPKGYYNAREFYSPMYDMAPSDKPDLRTTVFWSPNLVPDEKEQIKFDYFNTDQAGNYRIVIEGFDIEGRLVRKIYTYKVN